MFLRPGYGISLDTTLTSLHPFSYSFEIGAFTWGQGGPPNQRPLSDFPRWLQSLYSYLRLTPLACFFLFQLLICCL
ncbi:hypothetical protein L873DRAFT_1498231 [Choiromyces venosus 120613-1]|uniref:Uncharacterized protein n=1 Tax=Choiromyces venosus 120613-1 TaxID=1336337 RepID=A0A3N4J9S5_9PEZI|nr:hypothetical protein L873DRAFT_1498231 [Choiromyces venosus 120613-1]